MEFYLEAMRNDIDIASLDCDIEIDRTVLELEYYNNTENFYKECGHTDEDEYFIEAGKTIVSSLLDIVKSVIRFIDTCVSKVRELFTGKKMKDLKNRYEEAVRKNPKLKDAKINFPYDGNIIEIEDKNNNQMFIDISKMANASSEEIEAYINQTYYQKKKEQKERKRKFQRGVAKDTVNIMKFASAFALLGIIADRYYKNSKARQKLLKQIEGKAEETENKKIKALAKLAHEKEYKTTNKSTDLLRGAWIDLIDNIRGTTRDELNIILGSVTTIEGVLKRNKSVDDAVADNMAILDSKK